MTKVTFTPQVGTVVTVSEGYHKYDANFEAFSSDMLDVLVSVSAYPVQKTGETNLVWVPVETVVFHC